MTTHTDALRHTLSTLPAGPLRNVCAQIVEADCAAQLDDVKGSLNSVKFFAGLNPSDSSVVPVYIQARLALTEQRALFPRDGRGETPAYFRCLALREASLCTLFAGPLPTRTRAAHQGRAQGYHALAAVHRFTQPACAEPETVAKARALLDAIVASGVLKALTPEDLAQFQADYDESLFL